MSDPALAPVSVGKRRGQLIRRTAALVLLGSGCVFAYWAGTGFGGRSQAHGGLWVSEDSLDFGETWESLSFPWIVPVQNQTDQDILVEKFSTGCYCVQVEPASLLVKAGETANVRLAFNLMAAQPGQSNLAYFSAGLIPHVADSLDVDAGWTIKGRVRRHWLRMESNLLDFGDGLILGEKMPTKCAEVWTDPAVRTLRANFDPAQFLVRVIAPGKQGETNYQLDITPQTALPAGYFSSVLKLHATFADGREATLAPLQVQGVVNLPIELTPGSLLLGVQQVGSTLSQQVAVRSRRGRSLDVRGVKVSSEDVTVECLSAPSTVPEAAYRVRVKISQTGPQSRTVILSVREHEAAADVAVPLVVSYHGRPASVSQRVHPLAQE